MNTSSTVEESVCIIGGGYTGLVAALRLSQAGKHVTILERSDTLGGLAGGLMIAGAPIEKAYHHLFRTDTSIIALADELGIGELLEWHESRTALVWEGKIYPFATASDLLRFTPVSLVNRIRAGVVALYLQKQKDWERFEKVSALQWMRKYAGTSVSRVIWEPLLRGKFDRFFDKVSMAWLWARIHIRANSTEHKELGEKLGYFRGGFEAFTQALREALDREGVQIRFGVDITELRSEDSPEVVLRDGSRERYSAILATVPSHVFGTLVRAQTGDAYPEKLAQISYIGARVLVFSSSQRLSDYYWHNINDERYPFLVFLHHTSLIDPEVYGGRYIYYVATYTPMDSPSFVLSAEELEDQWFDGVKMLFPDFDRSAVEESHLFTFANAQHIVGLNYSDMIPGATTPLSGVYLSNFSQIYPEDRGTNFAVQAGEQAAELILRELAQR